MPASRSDLARYALAHLGQTILVTDVDTDNTLAAKAMALWLDQVLEEVAESFTWPWMRRWETLALVETFTGDTDEWLYSYRFPSDALAIQHVPNGVSRVVTNATAVPWLSTGDATGGLVYTDQEDAIAAYTSRAMALDTARFPAAYTACCALLLAHYTAPMIVTTGGDPGVLADKLLQRYEFRLAQLKARVANETPDQPATADVIASRD